MQCAALSVSWRSIGPRFKPRFKPRECVRATWSTSPILLAAVGRMFSDNTRYEQQDRKKGMRRWDVKVPAQSIGPKMFTLNCEIQMKYDKQLSIASLPLSK